MEKMAWLINIGDLVLVRSYDFYETRAVFLQGVVISDKFEDQNTIFPCVRVHIFAENDWRECFPHELEIISSV
jgi:hypothetical protein